MKILFAYHSIQSEIHFEHKDLSINPKPQDPTYSFYMQDTLGNKKENCEYKKEELTSNKTQEGFTFDSTKEETDFLNSLKF